MTKRLITILLYAFLLMILDKTYSQNNEPMLTIQSESQHTWLSRSELLSSKNIDHLTINNNRAYPKKKMTYTVVKLCDLLKPYEIKPTDTLEFIAADHFSVLIPATKITHCDQHSSIAYLAIESNHQWPLLRYHTGTTAGPFDVIWLNPEKSNISDEYWAWSIIKIVIHKKLNSNLVPSVPIVQDIKMQLHIKNGYDQYISHCAACHAINHIGKGVIGPDLNIPKNPVEYYPNDALLKKFIRDPESVRKIKYDRMSGSNAQFLSNADLDDLILYFHYMVNHKIYFHQS